MQYLEAFETISMCMPQMGVSRGLGSLAGGGAAFSQILPFQRMWSKKQAQEGGSSKFSLCSSGFFLPYWSVNRAATVHQKA